jgi:hypothetical protein
MLRMGIVLKMFAAICLLFSIAACSHEEAEVVSSKSSGNNTLNQLNGEWGKSNGKDDGIGHITVKGNVITLAFENQVMLLRFNYMNDQEVFATITEGPDEDNVGDKVVLTMSKDNQVLTFMDMKDGKVVHKTKYKRAE